MKQYLFTILFLFTIAYRAFSTGYDIRTSDIIDQPGVEVLGDFQGSWYAIGFEKPGTLQKPPRFKIFKYSTGVRDAKSSRMYPSFGEKTIYLKSVIMGGKICMFYGKCEHLAEKSTLHDSLEGRSQIDTIFRQDFDPITLESIGGPKIVFDEGDDHFSASGIDIVTSEDKNKVAVLIKCWYKHAKYKLILTDSKAGEVYAHIFEFKELKEYLRFLKLKVSNQGRVLIVTKVRNDIMTLSTDSKGKKEPHYDFLYIDNAGSGQKILTINSTVGRDHFYAEPVIGILNNEEMIIAFDDYQSEKSAVLKGTNVSKYDNNLNLISKKDISPDTKLIKQVSDYQNQKKEPAFSFLETQQVYPLEGGNFMLVAEYHHLTDNKEKPQAKILERGYMVTYRFDAQLGVKDFQFIPKKQLTTSFGYAMSAQLFRKGNDVFLFHNDDWESDGEHGMSLLCSRLNAAGGEPETKKIVHTSDDFFPCMDRIYFNGAGKVLISEEKSVDFEDVSREVKLLEVTLK